MVVGHQGRQRQAAVLADELRDFLPFAIPERAIAAMESSTRYYNG